jgi:hypothetical protein
MEMGNKRSFSESFMDALDQTFQRMSSSSRMTDAAGRNEGQLTGGRKARKPEDYPPEQGKAQMPPVVEEKPVDQSNSVAVLGDAAIHAQAMAAGERMKARIGRQGSGRMAIPKPAPDAEVEIQPDTDTAAWDAKFAPRQPVRESRDSRLRQRALDETMAQNRYPTPVEVSIDTEEALNPELKKRRGRWGKMTEA